MMSCRVSPLHGLSVAQYVSRASYLQKSLHHDCGFLIRACAAFDKEGGHLSLKELWRRAGGTASATASAQKMIDLLMRAPLVAIRTGNSDGSDAAWIITEKQSDVAYERLGSLVSAVEKPPAIGYRTIGKGRLAALKKLASSAADRRLIELAALDTATQPRTLGGNKNETVSARQERECAMHMALETFTAYEDLARLDTCAQISALLGDEITNDELRAEMERLKLQEEELELAEEDAILEAAFIPSRARYDLEDVAEEHEPEDDFLQVLEACNPSEADALAARLQSELEAVGSSITLDAAGLADPCKQEEMVQAFGEGWQDALRDCLAEPLCPARDDDSTVDDLDEEEGHLLDHAEAMVLGLKRELGLEPMEVDEEAEEAEADGSARELALLAQLTPKELVTKMLARNRRSRELQAARSAEVAAARRALAGEQGRAVCRDTVLGKWPDVGDTRLKPSARTSRWERTPSDATAPSPSTRR